MDFTPWWCAECQAHIPVSSLTHWTSDGKQHPAKPNVTDHANVRAFSRDTWFEHTDVARGLQWAAPGHYINATDDTGTQIYAEVKVTVARYPDGSPAYDDVVAAIKHALSSIYPENP